MRMWVVQLVVFSAADLMQITIGTSVGVMIFMMLLPLVDSSPFHSPSNYSSSATLLCKLDLLKV